MPDTKEATLTDLLDEWAELEPTKCEADTYDDPDGLGYFLLPQMKENQSWVPKPVSSGWNRGEVQAAVQEAVNARYWDWRIETVTPQSGDSPAFLAAIQVGRETHRSDGITNAHCPAAAILQAYIKALRAQQ